jgi:hypothetical protein
MKKGIILRIQARNHGNTTLALIYALMRQSPSNRFIVIGSLTS